MIWGGGQVDINYNELTVARGIMIFNANQSTTITGNTINYASEAFQAPDYDSDLRYDEYGIFVYQSGDDWAPRSNRTVIHNNTLSQGTDILHEKGALAGIFIADNDSVNHSVIASKNKITTSNVFDIDAWPIYLSGNSGATVTGNILRGNGIAGITIWPIEGSPVRGGTITNNNFLSNLSLADVFLYENTRDVIVGPQRASTLDLGSNNYVLN